MAKCEIDVEKKRKKKLSGHGEILIENQSPFWTLL
jgi:hypothetical protein